MPAGGLRATLNLEPVPESASQARRFTDDVLAGWGLEALSPDVALVVSELVTNAVLHARTAVELQLTSEAGAVRIEVCDGSVAPVLPKAVVPASVASSLLDDDADLELVEELLNVGATTGRGIQLVAQLSANWGYEPLPGEAGKKVWAVIGPGPVDPGLPGAPVPPMETPVMALPDVALSHPVRLVAVPVWLALESELHLDTLIREFQMIEAAGEVPEHAGGHAERARHFLDDLGAPLQAVQAALRRALERGDRLFDADLLVPVASAPELRKLTELLDEASEFSERGELLALAPVAAVRQFRRWYAEEIERQVGGQPPRPCPFSTVASEQAADGVAQEALTEREQALVDRVERDMSEATDLGELVRTFLTEAMSSLGVEHASIGLLAHDSDLVELVDSIGMPGGVSQHWAATRLGDDLPASEAMRTGEPVMIRTRNELLVRYPAFRGTPILDGWSFVCVPLTPTPGEEPAPTAGRRPTGCLNLSFSTSRELNREQLRLLCAIGSKLADALERLAGDSREEELRARWRAFDRLLAGLPGTSDFEVRLRWAVDSLAQMFDGWCGAFTAGPDGQVRLVASRHGDSQREQLSAEMQRRWPFRSEVGVVSRSVRSGQTVVYQVVPDDFLATAAVDDEHLTMLRQVAFSAFMVTPVRVDGEVRGAIGVGRHDGRYLTDADVRLVTELGNALGA